MRRGESTADILAGLREAISRRVVALLRSVGIADKFVITGGIAKNVGVVTKISERIGGIKIHIPAEPRPSR
jgi:benzoyl-CoA reductase subunit A